MSKKVEIVAEVRHEKARRDNWAAFLCKLDGEDLAHCPNREFSASGDMPADEIKCGLTYRLYGHWDQPHPKYGPQFKVSTFVVATPASRSGMVAYLQELPWIGPAFANKLWEKFGPSAVKVVRLDPEAAVAAIGSRITIEKMKEASAKAQEWAAVEETQIQLTDLLEGRCFPKTTIRNAIKKWGNKAAEIISRCPYRLMAFRGIGFLKTDKFYLDLGGDPNHRMRQGLCVAHEIANDTEGHIWMPRARAEKALRMKIAGTEVDPDKAIRWARTLGAIETRLDADGQGWVADVRLARAEANVAARILEAAAETRSLTITQFSTVAVSQEEILDHATCTRCRRMLTAKEVAVLDDQPFGPDCIQKVEGGEAAKRMPLQEWLEKHPVYRTHYEQVAAGVVEVKPRLAWPDVEKLEGISDHQREHLKRATAGVIGILGGAPGTGKTYSLAAMVKEIIRRYGLGSVEVCAPTGKAAVRCTESLAKYGINLRARTIHSTLGVVTSNDGDWGFAHDERNPLPSRFLIIDEFSMTDIRLASAVLSARARGMHVLIVGDVNQLPPVGAGAPLRDFIFAGLPYGELTEIRRNAGSIVKACASIRDRQTFETDDWLDIEADDPKNLKLIQATRAASPRVLLDTVRKIRDEALADPVWDVQIIVAVNKKSPMGREALNEKLQEMLNPNGYSVKGSPFRVGDKVIFSKNQWLSEAKDG